MLKTWKKAVSLVLVFAMSMMVCVPAFAAKKTSANQIHRSAETLVEQKEKTNFKGQQACHIIIKTSDDKTFYDGYVIEENGRRSVYSYKDGRLVDKKSVSIENPSVGLTRNATRAVSPGFSLIMSKAHPSLPITGNLYGKYGVYSGTTHKIQFSAGTASSTVVSVILSLLGEAAPVVAILEALGAAVVGSAIDTAISGKVRTKSYRWDYEVWANNQLGLKTYQADVYDLVVDTYSGNTSEVFDHTEGSNLSLADMCDEGSYYVYIENQ